MICAEFCIRPNSQLKINTAHIQRGILPSSAVLLSTLYGFSFNLGDGFKEKV